MTYLWLSLLVIILIFGFVVFRGAPYVPSQRFYVRQALNELYKLKQGDVLVDIGSGDGIILREASLMGARAVGYEINPILVVISWFLSRGDKNVTVRLADFWLSNLPDDTTVIYAFSISRDAAKLGKWVQNQANRLNHDIFLVSFGFEIGGCQPIKNFGAYYLYQFYSLQGDEAQV
jgi:hypothetical protein